MAADRGTHYVNEYRMNMAVLKGLTMVTDANGGQFPLLGLFVLPRAMAGAKQVEETYRCHVCKGKGYNHIGSGR